MSEFFLLLRLQENINVIFSAQFQFPNLHFASDKFMNNSYRDSYSNVYGACMSMDKDFFLFPFNNNFLSIFVLIRDHYSYQRQKFEYILQRG